MCHRLSPWGLYPGSRVGCVEDVFLSHRRFPVLLVHTTSGMWRPDLVMLLLASGLRSHCRLTDPASCSWWWAFGPEKKRCLDSMIKLHFCKNIGDPKMTFMLAIYPFLSKLFHKVLPTLLSLPSPPPRTPLPSSIFDCLMITGYKDSQPHAWWAEWVRRGFFFGWFLFLNLLWNQRRAYLGTWIWAKLPNDPCLFAFKRKQLGLELGLTHAFRTSCLQPPLLPPPLGKPKETHCQC